MSAPPLIDGNGRRFPLERQLASGGEGAVFSLPNDPQHVAKVYHKVPTPQTVEKLTAMVALANPQLLAVAAWPSGLLFHASTRGVAGFVMPRLNDYQPIQHLYNPVQRLKFFQRAAWHFQVRAARNLAAAFDEVHRTGCLVGDVNQSNAFVSVQALVRLIDCDSFQVHANGKRWLCEVGVAHYIPPELQGRPLRGLVRTENHDRFGLAVLIYQILFVGRHPYSGIYQGKGDPSFEELIRDFRFAQGPMARSWYMDPPPHTPTFTDIPPPLGMLFRRAFERGSELGNRPKPTEWCAALKDLEHHLAECSNDPGHRFWRGVQSCVWCRLSKNGGPEYFFGVAGDIGTFTPDNKKLQDVLRRLAACSLVTFPTERSQFLPPSPPPPRPLPAGVVDPHREGVLQLAITWFTSFYSTSPWYEELAQRHQEYKKATHRLQPIEEKWCSNVARYRKRHTELTQVVQRAVSGGGTLAAEYKVEVDRLTAKAQALARVRHLQLHLIADAEIDQIGAGRKQLLAQFGIYTAADVDAMRIRGIKGFGAVLTANLVAWKGEISGQFRFNPTTALAPADQRALTAKFKSRQQQVFTELERLLTELEQLAPVCRQSLEKLRPDLSRAISTWDQAKSDLQLMKNTKSRSRSALAGGIGLSVSSMVIGIVSAVIAVVSLCCVASVPVSAFGGSAAIVLGVFGLKRGGQPYAYTGIVLGTVAVFFALAALGLYAFVVGSNAPPGIR
jgi:DNA-binding helix-hairpin-helix protein with protein kinase domain